MAASINQDNIIECLNKQISELELFQTMYNPREIIITNDEVLEGIRNFVAENTIIPPNHLDYTIIQTVENLKLEISINLPSMYPELEPEIHVRCNQLNRYQEKQLNTDLTAYLQSKHNGEVCIFTAILWLQDYAESYYTINTIKPITQPHTNPKNQQKFTRYWIYSHHIHSKKKTEEIVRVSKELNLNGFCLLGKPGVICVEGVEEDCKEWWKYIKSLHWQKIGLRLTENVNPNEKSKLMKFNSFDVLNFRSATGHCDLGRFQKFMLQYGLIDQVNEFFHVQPS